MGISEGHRTGNRIIPRLEVWAPNMGPKAFSQDSIIVIVNREEQQAWKNKCKSKSFGVEWGPEIWGTYLAWVLPPPSNSLY